MKKFVGIVLALICLTSCSINHGDKFIVGYIVHIGTEGYIFKTNELEVMLGGLNSGKESISLSCPDASFLPALSEAFLKTKQVHVKYSDNDYFGCAKGETGRWVTGVVVDN